MIYITCTLFIVSLISACTFLVLLVYAMNLYVGKTRIKYVVDWHEDDIKELRRFYLWAFIIAVIATIITGLATGFLS